MEQAMFDVLILLSGGLDSAVLLRMAVVRGMDPFCLLIDYGQKHIAELESAKLLCDQYNVEREVIQIKNLNVSSKLINGEAKYKGVSEWHVPGRNLIFVGLAASVAESYNIPLIWYGANYDDRELLFPDCYQEWVHTMNQVLAINGSTPLRIEAPLLGMNKNMIKFLANLFEMDQSKIFSGYGEQ